MGSLKSVVYKGVVGTYKILPFKGFVCRAIKMMNIYNKKFYSDLNFNGKFKVNVGDKSFKMYHHGGKIENETFWNGLFVSWENDTGWIWQQLCKSADVVLDIGANTGIYSLVTKALNPKAKVFAFEPSINTFEKLSLNNKINNFDITCEQIALSNIDGEQIFYDTPNPNQTSASLSPDKLKNWEGYNGEMREYKVKTMTISNYIETNKITKIDLIKMDIEMHEPEAVEGLGKYLELFKPVVLIEVLSDKVANQLNSLIGEDYLRFHLKDNNTAEFVPKFKVVHGKWNYVFFHKDLEQKIRKETTLNW